MLERQGKVFTTVVDHVAAETLFKEIQEHSEKGSVFFTDQFRSYKSHKQYEYDGKGIRFEAGMKMA